MNLYPPASHAKISVDSDTGSPIIQHRIKMKNKKDILRSLAKTGFFHIFGSSVINKIITFLSSVVIVRILTKEEYGVFTHAWNIYSIIILLNGLGAASAVIQLCSERSGDEVYGQKICGYATRFGLLFDILIAAVMLLIGTVVPLKIQGSAVLIRLLCVLPAIRLLFDLACSYLRAQKRNRDFANLNTLNTIAVFGCTSIGALILREKGMIWGYYAAFILTVLVAVFHYRINLLPKVGLPSREDRHSLRSIAIVSMCNSSLSQLLYHIDIFALGYVFPQEEIIAGYRVATLIPSALPFIPHALITYVYPFFAEKRNDGAWCMRQYKRILLGMGGVNLAISAVLIVFAKPIIALLFGKNYLDILPIFRLLSLNYFIAGTFRTISGNLLVTQRKLKYNFVVALISGSLNIAADFLFLHWWGPIGAAIATIMVVLLTSVLNTGYLIFTFRKNT